MTRASYAAISLATLLLGFAPAKAPGVAYRPGSCPVRWPLAERIANPTIPELLVAAAAKYDLPIGRLMTQAWVESRLRDVTRFEFNGSRSCGPLQVNEGTVPGICEASLEAKVDAGARHLATFIERYGDQAEYVYMHGHLPKHLLIEPGMKN